MPEKGPEEEKSLHLSDGAPSTDGDEKDEELFWARDLVNVLVKAIKAFRFYPSDNPTLKGFQEELPRKFQLFLDRYYSFVLQISEYAFSFKGKVLYEDHDIKRSLAFVFYKDGLRELRFMKGLEEWEVNGFIGVIRRIGDLNQLEDDVVTLMWEKDFVHISYLATDEFLHVTPIVVPETAAHFRKGLVFQPPDHDIDVDVPERGREGTISPPSKPTEGHPAMPHRNIYTLTAREVERLQKEVESEIIPTFVFNVVDTIFEIIILEEEREPFQDAATMLDKILDAYLVLGEFKKATDLLKRIYLLLRAPGIKGWRAEIVRKLILGAGEEQRIERIGKAVENEVGIRVEDFFSYLTLLQRNSIKPLLKSLGEWKKSKTRRVTCDALAEIGKNAIETFAPYLDDPRWFLVRNVTYILGRIGKAEALPHVQKAFRHENPRVRREAVQALGLIGGPEAVRLLAEALADGEDYIRTMAALSLGRVGKKAGLAPLLEVIQSKEFPKREPLEMKAFFDAIGLIGSDEAIPALRQLLERKSWFGWGSSNEVRLGAAQTLATIGTSEAIAVLESGKASKEESIREACLQALRNKIV